MRFPVAREWVRVKDREGVFLVAGVDRERGVAGVIATEGEGGVVQVELESILRLDVTPGKYSL